jgi:hypothetical protein
VFPQVAKLFDFFLCLMLRFLFLCVHNLSMAKTPREKQGREMETFTKSSRAIDSRYIVQAVTGAGSHFFSPSSMRFFSSRVSGSGWAIEMGGGDMQYVVVTSERDTYRDSNPREYTVRWFIVTDQGRALECGSDDQGFQGYATARQARVAAAKLVAREAGI